MTSEQIWQMFEPSGDRGGVEFGMRMRRTDYEGSFQFFALADECANGLPCRPEWTGNAHEMTFTTMYCVPIRNGRAGRRFAMKAVYEHDYESGEDWVTYLKLIFLPVH